MNGRNLYSYFFIWLCISGLATRSLAQTITTGSITPASVCPGGAITITYTVSATFAATNTFSAQLSDATGAFTSPIVIGSVTSTTAGSINATIPASTANGSAYRVRIVASAPAVTSTNSSVLTVILPTAPATATAPDYCQNAPAVALVATPSANGSLNWYNTAATGGTPSSVATIPNTAITGTTNYYVSQSVNGCEGPRAAIAVTVKSLLNAPATTPAPTYCQNAPAVALVATASPGATLNWYGPNQTGGTASPTANIPSTTQAGTINYYVSQSINGCEGPRAAIPVTVNATPAPPGVNSFAVCQNASATLSATPATNGILNWYGTNQTGGTPSATAPVLSTATPGVTTYYVSQSISGCEGPRAAITVTVNPIPGPPAVTVPGAYCQNAPAVALVATPSANGSLNWYGTAATGGTPSTVATVPSTAAAGTTTYYVSQSISGCESARAGISVTVIPTPSAPVTATAPVYCQNASAVALAATPSANGTLNWYGLAATGGTASTTANIPNTSQPGTFTYYVSQTVGGCEGPRTSIAVLINPTPAIPGVRSFSACQNTTPVPLTATPLPNGTLNWYGTLASGGTPSPTPPTPPTTTAGSTTYYVSQSLNGCEGPRAAISVTINGIPVAPGVTNLAYCLQTQDQPIQTVPPLNAYGENLKWYNANGTFTTVAPIPSISQTGVQSYTVSQTYNGCEGPKSTLLVTVNTIAAPIIPKSLVTYCINDKAVPLEATATDGGSLRWIDPYNVVSNQAPTPYTLNTSIQAGGDPFYVYQIAGNGCYSARATIKVLVNSLPTLSLIPATTNINLGQRVPLQLKFTSSAPYSYTLSGGYSGVVNRADTTISLLPRATTTYQVLGIKNSCGVGLPGNPATATITVRVPTITTSALTSSTLCVGTSLAVPFTTTGEFNPGNLFRIELVSVADTSKKYSVPTTATASPVTAPLPLTLVGGQYYVHIKADNPEIAVTGSNSPTLLTVRPQATATLTGTQNVYEGYPANLTLTLGGDAPWTVTYADTIRSYSVTATTSPYAVEIRPTRSTTYRLLGVTNICGSGPVSGTAVVTVLPLLGVDDNSLDPLVKTYPVPTTALLTVELDLPLIRDPATLSLTDMSGRPVLQQTTRNKRHELDLTTQPNGLYLLHIQVGDRQTTRKVLKQ